MKKGHFGGRAASAAAVLLILSLMISFSGCFGGEESAVTEENYESVLSDTTVSEPIDIFIHDEESGEESTSAAEYSSAVTDTVTESASSIQYESETASAAGEKTSAAVETTSAKKETTSAVRSTTGQAQTAARAASSSPKASESFPGRFYYPRLSDKKKAVYTQLYNSASKGNNSFSMTVPESEFDISEIENAVYAFCYDFPEYCRLDTSFSTRYSTSGGQVSYTVSVNLCAFCRNSDGLDYDKRLAAEVKKIADAARQYSGDFEKIKYVHDYLCETVTYTNAAYLGSLTGPDYQLAHCAYGALLNGKAVCDGYASAFECIMHELGYECGIVLGKSRNQNHAWNVIKVKGEYYYVDVTWDDTDGDGTDYQYFCITRAETEQSHSFSSDYSYPNASATAMSYYENIGAVMDSYDYDRASEIINSQRNNDIIALKFSNKQSYDAAVADLTALSGKIREINGRRLVQYNNDPAAMIIKFYV